MESSNIVAISADIAAKDAAGLLEIRHNAASFPRLKDIPYADAYMRIHPIVTKALIYRGQQVTPKQVDTIAAAFLGELLSNFDRFGTAEITIEEIAYAVRQAVLGDDEMYGVNVASLYKAVVRYIKTEGAQLQKRKPATPDQLATIKAAYAGQMMKNVK